MCTRASRLVCVIFGSSTIVGIRCKVIDRRLRHRRAGIGAEDERRVAVAADQHIDRRKFARVEPRIAAVEGDAERDSRSCQRRMTSAPVTLPCPRIGMPTNFVKAFISAASVSSAARVHVLAAGHRQAHAEEEAAELRTSSSGR